MNGVDMPPSAARAAQPLVELQGLGKRYNVGRPNETEVLHGVDLSIMTSEFVALVGPSGSGKSTLLNVLGLLEPPSAGTYRLDGLDCSDLTDDARTHARQRTLGFVFQFHHLLPAFTALENVTMSALARDGRVSAAVLARAKDLLAGVGLAHAMHKRPGELSGGMQQRVAVARALILSPKLVLADEPTGNLDTASSDEVFELLRQMHRQDGTSFLIVTHDPGLAARCDRRLDMVDGRLASDVMQGGGRSPAP